MKIFDAILFFNELDILNIRLTLLDPYVDYFIISECDSTFSGLPKPFYFEENKHLFSKFLNKIIHIKNYNSVNTNLVENPYSGEKAELYENILLHYNRIKNTAQTDNGKEHWCRDFLHREYTKLGMDICNDEDIILFSDTDEIPNPEVLKNIKNLDLTKKYCLLQDNNNYYINNISSTNWRGNIITNFRYLKNKSLNELRVVSRRPSCTEFTFINNAGWHLSFMGGHERIQEKIKSYGHQEFNREGYLNSVKNNIEQNKDLFFRTSTTYRSDTETFYFDSMKTVDINGYMPENIVSLVNSKYPYLIKR